MFKTIYLGKLPGVNRAVGHQFVLYFDYLGLTNRHQKDFVVGRLFQMRMETFLYHFLLLPTRTNEIDICPKSLIIVNFTLIATVIDNYWH